MLMHLPMPVKNRAVISVVVPPDVLEALDAARGTTPRSQVICAAVRAWLAKQEKSSGKAA